MAPRQPRGGRMADVPAPEPAAPAAPYRIADEALFIYDPDSGAIPARAFNAGDRVPSDLVENYGWAGLTHDPDWATAPDPDTERAPAPPAPATDTGPQGGSED